MSFIGEIRRRKVFQVAAVYAVVAWLLVQITTAIETPLNLPDWVDTLVIVLLAVGFPIALVLGWIFELTPEGIRPSESEAGERSAQQSVGQRFSYISQALVVVAVGFLVLDQYVIGGRESDAAADSILEQTNAPVSRLLVTPPAEFPLANVGGYDVAVSRDGTRIAYLAQDRGNAGLALFVRDIDALEARQLVGSDVLLAAGNANPFFSPDGNYIGFRSPQGMMRVSVNGGPPLKFAEDVGNFLGATWASDGAIIYADGTGLYRVPATGSFAPERLIPQEANIRGVLIAPSLLPGERAVVMSNFDGDSERLVVFNLDTREVKVLIEEGNSQNPRYIDSGHVVYARGTTLMAIPFDVDELAATGESFVVQQGVRQPGAGSASDFAVSASGTLVYVSDTATARLMPIGGSQLVWVDREGQILERVLTEPVSSLAADPRLSPDGTKLVLRDGLAIAGTLWVYDLRGSPPIPLATGGLNVKPVWSPDSSEIAYTSWATTGDRIYRVTADGSVLRPEPLAISGNSLQTQDWSRNDELILQRRSGDVSFDILISDLSSSGEISDLVVTDDNEFDAALSPGGGWLAYVSDRSGQNEIWVKRFPDGVPLRLSGNGGAEPRWAPDESEIFYLSGDAMMSVPVVESEPERTFGSAELLFRHDFVVGFGPGISSYDVSRDGRFLMIERDRSSIGEGVSDSIIVVQNWLKEIQDLVAVD